MKHSFVLFSCVFVFFFVFFRVVNIGKAASFYFESDKQTISIGDNAKISLFFDAEGESVNALSGEAVLGGHLVLVEVSDGDSFLHPWVDAPAVQGERIVFSGIAPGGYSGTLSPFWKGYKPDKVFDFIVRGTKLGTERITVNRPMVLLNDGLGTPVKVSVRELSVNIKEVEIPYKEVRLLKIEDTEPPENFRPELVRDKSLFEGKWFLIFITQDKQSGIARYEIHESTRKKDTARINAKEWAESESPYLLKDQSLKSYIYVKAVDRTGNETVATVSPSPARRPALYGFWSGIIIAGVVLLIFLWKIYAKKH